MAKRFSAYEVVRYCSEFESVADLCCANLEEAALIALDLRWRYKKHPVAIYKAAGGRWHVVACRDNLNVVVRPTKRKGAKRAKGKALIAFLESAGLAVRFARTIKVD